MRPHSHPDGEPCDDVDPYTGDPDLGHEALLEALVTHLLGDASFEELCTDADRPVLIHDTGEPVTIAARTYTAAGVLTLDRGVRVELSDGSAYGLSITVSRRPTVEVHRRR